MPAVFMTSSNVSFFSPATNDRVLGSTASTSSGIGSTSFSFKYFAYLLTLSFLWSWGDFFVFCSCDYQESDVSGGLCAGGIVLTDENEKSSGFGEGFISLNMSVGEFVVGEISVGSSIVAF